MAEKFWWVAASWATWVQFQHGAETLCLPLAILCGTEPVSALTCLLFILLCFEAAALYNFFSWALSVAISHRQGFNS